MNMKRLLAILFLASCATAFAQTGITVMADTNRVIRTNFFISNSQVQGLTNLLNTKLATNGDAAGLTNITAARITGTVALASNVSGIISIANGGTGSQTASNARTALGLGTAATNAASAFQPASTNLDTLALNNGGLLTNLNAQNFLPSYSNNALKVLAVASNESSIEWTAISNTVTDGSTITNIPAANLSGIVGLANGGTGGSNAASARVNLLPAYTNNASKVLALNTNATDVEWITITNTGGGGTSGVTSVDVSGGSTGLTASGGPITNSGTITLGGTLSIAAGGTGQTNAAAAIEALLPDYTNNEGKVLGLDTNLALIWTTNAGGGGGGSGTVTSVDASGGSTGMNFTGGPVTTNGTLTLGGTLAIGSGGTGANDLTNARISLLPSYTNNAGRVLAINSSTNDLEWIAVATAPVSVANGGTGGTNTNSALIGLGILKDGGDTVRIGGPNTFAQQAAYKSVVIGDYAGSSDWYGIAIGNGSLVGTTADYGVAIGSGAYVDDKNGAGYAGAAVAPNGSVVGLGGAVGYSADVDGDGGAVGHQSYAEDGGAIGKWALAINGFAGGFDADATATNSIQLGVGTNATENTIQIYSAGSVTTNQWSALANSTTFGHYIMAAPTNGTNGQVLAVNSNATAVIWTNVAGVQADLTNVINTLAVANGGTGATTASNARANLLPSYTGNQNLVLALNSNATDVVWSAAGSGVVDLSTTNATGILPVSKGGTGASTTNGALTNLGIITSLSVHIPAITNSTSSAVIIGKSITYTGGGNVVVGDSATGGGGTGSGGVAIGRGSKVTNSGTAIGYQADASLGSALGYQTVVTSYGAAIGYQAKATNSGDVAIGQSATAAAANAVQIGSGSNTNTNTIQFRSAGNVNETEWSYLANASTQGGYAMTNTAGISGSKTFVAYDGTNYTTNTVTFSNGIITGWTP